jgi:hypothetical protein
MAVVMIRVDDAFKKLLQNTQTSIRKLSGKDITMEELTKLLATNSDGQSGMLSIKFPVILLPEKEVKSKKSWREKYLNIVIEDKPR